MAKIIGGIGASHSPTIGFAKVRKPPTDPDWQKVFEAFDPVQSWLLGVDDRYETADEFDASFFQKKPIDHGLFSPLSMMTDRGDVWSGAIVPLQVGVLQFPIPTARRCFALGKALRRAIESYPEDLSVAVVSTGGLSHQVHGERCGLNNVEWDENFLDAVINENRSAPEPDQLEAHRSLVARQLAGAESLEGTHPFTLDRAHRAFRLNDFLHRLVIPQHRQRFVEDPEALYAEHGLSETERQLKK